MVNGHIATNTSAVCTGMGFAGAKPTFHVRGGAMWFFLSDTEAAAFIAIVTIMVVMALAMAFG